MTFIYGLIIGCVLGMIAGGVYLWIYIGSRFILVRHYDQIDEDVLAESKRIWQDSR